MWLRSWTKEIPPINRTIMELKLHIARLLKRKGLDYQSHHHGIETVYTDYMTIMDYLYQSHHHGIETWFLFVFPEKLQSYQSHHHGIETPEHTASKGRRNDYQSHHHGIETLSGFQS